MTDTKTSRDPSTARFRPRLSEAEIFQLLQEAKREYEEYIHLTDLADIPETVEEDIQPRYSWDNPIGLVITEKPHAKLV